MKKIQIAGLTALSLLGSLTAVQAASATTAPVGYETVTLQPNQFNLLGVRLHGAVVHTGTFESFTEFSLIDTEASFDLVAATPYIVELADGSNFNIIGSDASGTTITFEDVILAGDVQAYTIRKANTLNSVLGNPPVNLAASADGSTANTDKVWVPDGLGAFGTYYYIGTNGSGIPVGWYDFFSPSVPVGDTVVINPASTFFVQTLGSTTGTTNITVVGSVKTTPTAYKITTEWNTLSSEYPAGATLESSGLSANIVQSTDGSTAGVDKVWVPDGLGAFGTYYYIGTNGSGIPVGWYDFFSPSVPVGDTVLPTSFYIQDANSAGGGAISPPASYSGL